ncbi:hypothetical protein PG993_010117 [Apiospora rasikravindrae]|uniref:Polyketide synthase n=1 Tax=Apiospora rasikravindrae TaxID=990691 RepID=A0ABR1SLM0_9PEZI
MEPVAIIGFSFRLPQGTLNEERLWEVMQNRENLTSDWPAERLNIKSFCDNGNTKGTRSTLAARGGHFLKEDITGFDAPFFSVSSNEAAAMDPQHRWALEVAYQSFESALDLACQSMRNGDTDAEALILASSMFMSPETSIMLGNMNFLSPDSRCYSFDHRANGYARGEGVLGLVVKPLSAAISHGDTIRAVIRATGSNQDGHTPTLTQPSVDSQERLIREVYRKAGLDYGSTRYFEAHGTGTPTGDPIEMEAIGRVFRTSRSEKDPLYVGSVKANVGHLEGGSGLAGIIKTVMILEQGIIPPNALFERLNPAIDSKFCRTTVPTQSVPWPADSLRRVSVNSFGIGGTNAHTIIDGACDYLHEHGITGKHHCMLGQFGAVGRQTLPCHKDEISVANGIMSTHGHVVSKQCKTAEALKAAPRLLVWSGFDEATAKKVTSQYRNYLQMLFKKPDQTTSLSNLAHTLHKRRSHLMWRSFAVVSGGPPQKADDLIITKPVRSLDDYAVAFVFTGQGAQYVGMGLGLLRYEEFQNSLKEIDEIFAVLGCPWSLFDELFTEENIDQPDYSQPLCTALQIALVDLLETFNITPTVVAGHSSGEIAAAYAAGVLSRRSACKIAYYRGQLAARLRNSTPHPGAMLSVNLAEHNILDRARNVAGSSAEWGDIHIACINSPYNTTVSGSVSAIDKLKLKLDKEGIFARKVNTGAAYHSPAMNSIAEEYSTLIGPIESRGGANKGRVQMVSSVSGAIISPKLLSTTQYWADNLTLPVRFSQAILCLSGVMKNGKPSGVSGSILEIGPHATLRRPIQDSLDVTSDVSGKAEFDSLGYLSVLHKSKDAVQSLMELGGHLYSFGYPIDVSAVNQCSPGSSPLTLSDCPSYPFNHSRQFWWKSRLGHDFRFRGDSIPNILGRRSMDWNPLEPRWRNILTLASMPWLADHVVNKNVVVPGAAMLVMAVQAAHQLATADQELAGFLIKTARFLNPIIVSPSEGQVETVVQARPVRKAYEKEVRWFDVTIFSSSNGQWTQCFDSRIMLQFVDHFSNLEGQDEQTLEHDRIRQRHHETVSACSQEIAPRAFYTFLKEFIGLSYGKSFQILEKIRWDLHDSATATVNLESTGPPMTGDFPQPTVLDAAIHLCLAQLSRGLSVSKATLVPHELSNTWISCRGWKGSTLELESTAKQHKEGASAEMTVNILSDSNTPLCSIGCLKLAPVSRSSAHQLQDEFHLYTVKSRHQLSPLGAKKLQELCSAATHVEARYLGFERALSPSLVFYARKALSEVSEGDIQHGPPHMGKYVSSIKALLADRPSGPDPRKAITRTYFSNTTMRHHRGGCKVDDYYASIFDDLCDSRLQTFLQLLSHEKPQLRILEVGAGTGAMTRGILGALHQFEVEEGSSKFSSYTYTDISPAFFANAKAEFQQFGDRVTFQKFNLELDGEAQGFTADSYDLIVAGSVIHAVSDVTATLQILRKLLKDSGHLLLLETVAPQSPCVSIMWGLLPSWWMAKEDWRSTTPLLKEAQWGQVLQQTGFSGADVILSDQEDPDKRLCSIIISTAVARPSAALQNGTAQNLDTIIVFNEQSDSQTRLASCVAESHGGGTLPLGAVKGKDAIKKNNIVIFLLDVGESFLSAAPEEGFDKMKMVLQQAERVLWVSSSDPKSPEYALHGLAKGFLRTLRSEFGEPRRIRQQGVNIFFLRVPQPPEAEYCIRDGLFFVERVVKEADLERRVRASSIAQPRNESWLSGSAVKLEIPIPGILDTLRFVEDAEFYETPLPADHVHIQARAWPLSFRDIFIALGRLEGESLGFECSGVVSRVGSNVTEIRPGDRVLCASPGCIKTYSSPHVDFVQKLPEGMSFENAVSGVNPAMTAYYSLIIQARLAKRGEAKHVGAEVFATVGSREKRQLLVDHFGIPVDHIFYSRNTTFASGIMRATGHRGVNVVLNSLSGDGLLASWECVAPYGRFVEIGKADISSNSALPMSGFKKNVSFFAVDLHHMALSNRALVKDILSHVTDLFAQKVLRNPFPCHIFSIWDLEQALRYMQSGKHTGRIVMTADDTREGTKYVRPRCTWKFAEEASYVVAGGFGGLGRSIIRWMASRGAKNFIVLSRSGPSSFGPVALLMQELAAQSVHVFAPQCDASSDTSLRAVIEECGRCMPPIKGCINAAMVLQDAIFDTMSHARFRLAINTKVRSSWNLHHLLPSGLDFFILLSSLSGIYGSTGQSNYAAGCTYQDALARYRIAQGEKAVSFDVGWMRTIGIIAERDDYRQIREMTGDMVPIEEQDFLALLEVYCDPRYEASLDKAQLLIGARTPAEYLDRGHTHIETWEHPLFRGFRRREAGGAGGADNATRGDGVATAGVDDTQLFQRATSGPERSGVVVKALAVKLARAVAIPPEDIRPARSLSDYGVDSLVAVELRNWITNKFRAQVDVFDIMGGKSIQSIADLVSDRSAYSLQNQDAGGE